MKMEVCPVVFGNVILPETTSFLCETIVGECVKISPAFEAGRYDVNEYRTNEGIILESRWWCSC